MEDNKGDCQVRNPRFWGKPLLVLHLFFCCLWLFIFGTNNQPPDWTIHLFIWSIVGIQLTWGFTVGLIVGPGRATRFNLWWSALLSFFPLYFLSLYAMVISYELGIFWGILYFLTFVGIIICETFCGLLLGAKAHIIIRGE